MAGRALAILATQANNGEIIARAERGRTMDFKQIDLIDAVSADDLTKVKVLADGRDPLRPLTRHEYSSWYFNKYHVGPFRREPKDDELGFQVIFEARSYEMFKLLINKGADLKAVDARHETSILHYILGWGSLEMKFENDFFHKDKLRFAILELLLASGVEVDILDPQSGLTALQKACGDKDDGAVINLLLKHGASVKAVDANGDTALHAAAFYYPKWPLDKNWRSDGEPVPADAGQILEMIEPWGAQEAVEALVRAGADPNTLNPRNGYTPLHWASVHDSEPYLECLEALYKLGGKVSPPNRAGRRPMDFPVPKNDKKAARLKEEFMQAAQKEAGENVEARTAAALAAFSFESPQVMMWDAVFYNDGQTLQAALAAGADPNLPMSSAEYEAWLYRVNCGTPVINIDNDLRQPQFHVIYEALKYPEILKILLESGADTGVINGYIGQHPILHELIFGVTYGLYEDGGNWNSLVYLLEAGADVDMRGEKDQTPLQYACWQKLDGSLISILLKYGASVQAVDIDGDTALHGAGFHDEWYKAWPLDCHDETEANEPDESDNYQHWGAREIVQVLVEAGADPNAVNPYNGYTPMHWAMQHGYAYLPFLEALFERGGRVDMADHKGLRPIDFYDDSPEGEALRERFKKHLQAQAESRQTGEGSKK